MNESPHGFSFANPAQVLQDYVDAIRGLLNERPRSGASDAFRSGMLDAAGRLACSGINLPEECCHCSENGYGRNLVYREEDQRFTIVAMVWPAGASTPIHDHGTWCCESVICGSIEVTPFQRGERAGRGESGGANGAGQILTELPKIVLQTGEADCLLPPQDLHAVANPFGERAITIHTYGREMECCNIFDAESGEMERLNLCYANV